MIRTKKLTLSNTTPSPKQSEDTGQQFCRRSLQSGLLFFSWGTEITASGRISTAVRCSSHAISGTWYHMDLLLVMWARRSYAGFLHWKVTTFPFCTLRTRLRNRVTQAPPTFMGKSNFSSTSGRANPQRICEHMYMLKWPEQWISIWGEIVWGCAALLFSPWSSAHSFRHSLVGPAWGRSYHVVQVVSDSSSSMCKSFPFPPIYSFIQISAGSNGCLSYSLVF